MINSPTVIEPAGSQTAYTVTAQPKKEVKNKYGPPDESLGRINNIAVKDADYEVKVQVTHRFNDQGVSVTAREALLKDRKSEFSLGTLTGVGGVVICVGAICAAGTVCGTTLPAGGAYPIIGGLGGTAIGGAGIAAIVVSGVHAYKSFKAVVLANTALKTNLGWRRELQCDLDNPPTPAVILEAVQPTLEEEIPELPSRAVVDEEIRAELELEPRAIYINYPPLRPASVVETQPTSHTESTF